MKDIKANLKKVGGIPHLITTKDGSPVSLSMMLRGKPFSLSAGHCSFPAVVAELKKANPDEKKLVGLVNAQEALIEYSNSAVTISNGRVFYKGKALGGTVVTRVLEFLRSGLPYEPILNFIQNLPDNESYRDALYKFLENKSLTITPDGCFLAYKGVYENYCSGHDNNLPSIGGTVLIENKLRFKIGDAPRCNREDCDLNPHQECGRGIHIGSYGFAQSYGGSTGHMMLVKVNPKHIVSVPDGSNIDKLRVHNLEVVAEISETGNRFGDELTGTYTNVKKLRGKASVKAKRAAKKRRAEGRRNKLAKRKKSRR